MAVAEALTNLAAADIGNLKRVKLSANWMAAARRTRAKMPRLYETVKAVGEELCRQLGVIDPGGQGLPVHATRWQRGRRGASR